MTPPTQHDGDDAGTIERLRRGLLGIAAVTLAGTAVELTTTQHWDEPVQLIAWGAVALLVVALGLAWRVQGTRATRAVRVIAAVVMVSAAFGVVQHIVGNYEVGPLDAVYGEQWESMSEASRWWTATIQAVGPSPALAPGVLVVSALCVLLAVSARTSSTPEH